MQRMPADIDINAVNPERFFRQLPLAAVRDIENAALRMESGQVKIKSPSAPA
jgi:hypothetical protein